MKLSGQYFAILYALCFSSIFFLFLHLLLIFNCTWHGIKADTFLWPFHLADDASQFWMVNVCSHIQDWNSLVCLMIGMIGSRNRRVVYLIVWQRCKLNAFWKCHFQPIFSVCGCFRNGMFEKSTMMDSVRGAFSINI